MTARLPADRDIWRIAFPMILSNITVPMLGMVDTAVTGHLDSPDYLAAVAIGSAIFGVIYTGVNFLRMGTTGIAAQRFGADDYDGLRTALGQAVIVALALAILLFMCRPLIASSGIALLGATGNVSTLAAEYFNIRLWSAPATLAGYVLFGWFIGIADARSPLLIVVTVNVINIVLDLVFVVGLGMDVAGVALASVIAEYTGVLLGLFLVMKALKKYPGSFVHERFTRLAEYTAFFAVNANLFIRTLALMFAITWVTAQGARFGPAFLAANAVLLQFQNLMAFALDGIAHAAEALVGRAVGAKDRESLVISVRLSLKWSMLFAIAFSAAYFIGGPSLIRLMTDLPEIRSLAIEYLPWMVLSPVISVWSFVYDGVFVGATRSKEMRNVMLVSTFCVFLPAWWLLLGYGNHGLWAAFLLLQLSRGIGMHLLYKSRVLPLAACRT